MPSPFPGMDPFLEAQPYWSDFHTAMIMAIKGELQHLVPARYSVWGDIHVWLHEADAKSRLKRSPDVFVTTKGNRLTSVREAPNLAAPATTLLPAVRRTGSRFLKIREAKTDRVVTVLELLSPSNKRPGEERDEYLRKRGEYFAQRINLVEIDLLRGGTRMPLGRPKPPETPYYVVVCRGIEHPRMGVWPVKLRERLPDIPVPLNPEDDLVWLPLQKCFEGAYLQGPYAKEIDYSKRPKPALDPKDQTWVERVVLPKYTQPS